MLVVIHDNLRMRRTDLRYSNRRLVLALNFTFELSARTADDPFCACGSCVRNSNWTPRPIAAPNSTDLFCACTSCIRNLNWASGPIADRNSGDPFCACASCLEYLTSLLSAHFCLIKVARECMGAKMIIPLFLIVRTHQRAYNEGILYKIGAKSFLTIIKPYNSIIFTRLNCYFIQHCYLRT